MSRLLHFCFFMLFAYPALTAQELFMPLNLRKAYDNGTRSMDGKPGPKYWQNRAAYDLRVNIDLPTRVVNGAADIRYENNSPDTLKMIRLKLAHDLWRKNSQRAYELPAADLTDGVKVSGVKVAGIPVDPKQCSQSNTFYDIQLSSPLPPGQSLQLSLEWSYSAPASKGSPRECVCDSTTWFMAYWYPTMAVYDDLHGWASVPYNGLQEMYNDFSDYKISVTVPANIMVWATGVWQNPEELLTTPYFQRYREAEASGELVKIFSPEDYARNARFFKASGTHTFVYEAKEVPDVALAFSDHYLWDAKTITVDRKTGRQALISAAYDPDSPDYYEVCEYAAKGIDIMSNWLPGYPYPYPRMTVFNGDDGMEFPMMCNDASTHPRSPIGLTVHESSHTYFPFMMGINEQYYAWMDEGWAAFFDVLVSDSVAGKPIGSMRDYPTFAGTDQDMPPMTPSWQLARQAYRVASYNRPQAAYFALYQMLGYERFHQCMTTYMDRWKGKHPQPFDFFQTWNEASGENLNWFWKPWFFDWGYPDLSASGVVNKNGKTYVHIRNEGTLPVSVTGEIEFSDGSVQAFFHTAEVWKNGNKLLEIPVPAKKTTVGIRLTHNKVPDVRKDNDIWVGR